MKEKTKEIPRECGSRTEQARENQKPGTCAGQSHRSEGIEQQPRVIWSNEAYTNTQLLYIAGHSLTYADTDFW